jgi:hypothetical protein
MTKKYAHLGQVLQPCLTSAGKGVSGGLKYLVDLLQENGRV